jgi:TatD DNase family protein
LRITDTHIHLYDEGFDTDRDHLMQEAISNKVSRWLLPNIDIDSMDIMWKLCNQYRQSCFPMLGLHPCYVKDDFSVKLNHIRKDLEKNIFRVVAIGEIGLDYYWDLTYKNQQIEALEIQLGWAHEFNMPVSMHSREATQELIDLLKSTSQRPLTGVFHCFSGTLRQAEEIIELGYFIGVGGVVTFKNSGLAGVIGKLPVQSLVLETDAPYLAPTPHRGKRNEPSYLRLIAEKTAQLLQMSLEDFTSQIELNTEKIFPKILQSASE